MKFTLSYDGPLPSSGNKPKNQAKWEIRSAISPQLQDLWSSHPAMQLVKIRRFFPKSGGFYMEGHHSISYPIVEIKNTTNEEQIDLCSPINKHGSWFLPLVRDSFDLHCGLRIIFQRREEPGRIYQGGDIDGRLKTLIDGLTMPQHAEQIADPENGSTSEAPIYCLLEDDHMISGLSVESERLLGHSNQAKDYVRLTIEVDVRVRTARGYNQSFLG